MEMDLNLFFEKKKNKFFNQKTRDAKKAMEKAEKEAQKAKDKANIEAKKGKRACKSKVVAAPTPPLLLTQTSIGLPSQNLCKQDASFAELPVLRLQQSTSPAFKDYARDTLYVDEFFFSRFLQTTDAYHQQHYAFPKEWVDMQAFLNKVFLFLCFPLLYDGNA